MNRQYVLFLVVALLATLLSGCASVNRVIHSSTATTDLTTDLLTYKQQAIKADAETWQAMYDALPQDGNQSFEQSVQKATLLGLPTRTLEENELSVQLLRSALNKSLTHPPIYRDLIMLSLTETEQGIARRKSLDKAQQQFQSNRQNCEAAVRKHGNLKVQVEVLQKALVEAYAKINSLTRIEQSIDRSRGREIP